MGRFDDLFLKLKEMADNAGTKAQEVAELTKVKIQATQLRNDMDANYLKLGEIIYELEKSGTENPELVHMCIAEIEAQQKELSELEEKINEMKKIVKCPECAGESPVGSLFCARCGASLTKKQEQEEPQTEGEAATTLDAVDQPKD